MSLIVHNIPAFTDNYFWLFQQLDSLRAGIVDPGDAAPVLAALKRLNLTLEAILITHHHHDHTGGIDELLNQYSVPVYGPSGVSRVTHVVTANSEITVANSQFKVLAIPGHTLDHIAYYNAGESLIFCGDTLFANGCGRLFEGTPAQMWHSLSQLASLPAETKIYCAHEYTQANTTFALAVEPENYALQQRAKEITALRLKHKPTVPSLLSTELATNPFLRANTKAVQLAAAKYGRCQVNSDIEAFALIRDWKDNF